MDRVDCRGSLDSRSSVRDYLSDTRDAILDDALDAGLEKVRKDVRGGFKGLVLDLRNEETIWATNRFMIYALFPTANISIHVMWGLQKQNTVLATGKSILDRSSQVHIGNLMLEFGGGGHAAAGTCQVSNDKADTILQTLVQRITLEN